MFGLSTTAAYESYWRFAAERHRMYLRRLDGSPRPWTDDPVLRTYRFTNVYRATDRVSQFLIREVLYRDDRSQAPNEIFFRALLFKLFNKIETWELLEMALGPIGSQSTDLNEVAAHLDVALRQGRRIYSNAYIMPPPQLGHARKHANHLALLSRMMADDLPNRIKQCQSLEDVYGHLLPYPGVGPFLAFQYAIDLNYSTMLDFDEKDFVVAGPGALDGIAKCFNEHVRSPVDIIRMMTDIQESEFRRLNLPFAGLFGRRLQPIDCQNIFCELSKYARVVHPELPGEAGRTRIKQTYSPREDYLETPVFPPRWRLHVPAQLHDRPRPNTRMNQQSSLF